jgi:3-hydroxymyristoyl/3-hydroxydecanoyl-(acyl carrier protein) dehydratase
VSGVEVWADDEGVLSIRSSFLAGGPERMGDLIETLPDGRFHLRGRADRVAKIDGKRISLARVEEALRALPEIADVYAVALPSDTGEVLGAAVVLAKEGGDELAKLGSFRFGRKLRADLAGRLESAERPKRWRFVGRLPENTQGKRKAGEIAGLFEGGSMLEELSAQVEVAEDEARVAFELQPSLSFFEGHFPGRPVLAGVAQTHLATRLGEEIWGFLPGAFQVHRLKFRRMIQPGEKIVLTLTRDVAKARLGFNFSADGEPASEGVIGP